MTTTTIKNTTSIKYVLAIAAALMALVLACGVCPGTASASPASDEQADAAGLSTQADTQTVYVITGTKSVADWGIKSTVTSKYTYNSNGLLTTINSSSNMDGDSTTTYTYNGTNLKGVQLKQQDESAPNIVTTFTTNKKGQITKAVQKSNYTATYTATYKSGLVKKIVCKEEVGSGDETSVTKDTFKYTYKNGRMATRTAYGTKIKYGYDAQGNINDIGGSKYKNTYNSKKQLTKTTLSEEGYTYKVTYTYKAIKVKASVAEKVQAQQWAIINNNKNFALGIDQA